MVLEVFTELPYMAVAVGGFFGACLRFALSEWIGTWNGFPIATLLINVVGSLFLGWFLTITSERSTLSIHPNLRLAIGTGFVGAFTTFSTFTVEIWKLMQVGSYLTAMSYVALSLIVGLLGSGTGYRIARIQVQRTES